MPKILFIQPTQYAPDGSLCKQKRLYLPGLVFPLLAALTPKQWDVEINLEVVDTVNFDNDADIIGIGSMGFATFRGLDIAREFRKRGKKVVMGGYMASIMAEEVSKSVDSVIIGDAEQAYPKMLQDFESGGALKKIYEIPVDSLEGLPLPRYELLLEKPIGSMLPVQAGRGCSHTCSFCSIACIYKGRYMFRPVEEVVRDIKMVRDLGYKRFYLIDDNIVSNPDYFKALCRKIIPLKMRWATQCSLELAHDDELLSLAVKAGAELMSFGVESISQESLNKLGKPWVRADRHEQDIKKLSQAGISVSTEMIIGAEGDTEESIRATAAFIDKLKIPIPRFYILTPMPGTRLFKEYKAAGRLITEDFKEYSGTRCVFRPTNITADKIDELYWWLYETVFSIKSIVKRTIFNRTAVRNPAMLIFAFVVNMHYRRYIKKRVPPNIF
jgi:radical SAM superfamily enzyme YgiQ (UPF0313 family)